MLLLRNVKMCLYTLACRLFGSVADMLCLTVNSFELVEAEDEQIEAKDNASPG